jgi:hypothetical protein
MMIIAMKPKNKIVEVKKANVFIRFYALDKDKELEKRYIKFLATFRNTLLKLGFTRKISYKITLSLDNQILLHHKYSDILDLEYNRLEDILNSRRFLNWDNTKEGRFFWLKITELFRLYNL